VDLEMSGVLWFADGRVATFDCGFASPQRQWLEITGTDGVIFVPKMWLPDTEAPFVVQRDGAEDEVVRVPGHDQIAMMLDDFSRAVLEGGEVRPAASEAVATLGVLDALARSAREGKAVEV
jgi:predicted dehydrogenase